MIILYIGSTEQYKHLVLRCFQLHRNITVLTKLLSYEISTRKNATDKFLPFKTLQFNLAIKHVAIIILLSKQYVSLKIPRSLLVHETVITVPVLYTPVYINFSVRNVVLWLVCSSLGLTYSLGRHKTMKVCRCYSNVKCICAEYQEVISYF